jgi:hypothetical protein
VLQQCDGDAVDRTTEALNFAGCQQWNTRVAYIESTGSYMYEAPGEVPVQIPRDSTIQNVMLAYSKLSLQQWLAHPNCRRFHLTGITAKQKSSTWTWRSAAATTQSYAIVGSRCPLCKSVETGGQNTCFQTRGANDDFIQSWHAWRAAPLDAGAVPAEAAWSRLTSACFSGGALTVPPAARALSSIMGVPSYTPMGIVMTPHLVYTFL